MNIIAIDPGCANTGIVYMSEFSIVCSKTISGPPVRNDKEKLLERAQSITRQILAFIADKPHEMVVIEGFTGGFTGRQNAFTHQTPYLVGYLERALEHADEPFVVQLSTEVLNPRAKNSMVSYDDYSPSKNHAKINALKRSGWKDIDLLKSDHTRAAALHGAYYYLNKRED